MLVKHSTYTSWNDTQLVASMTAGDKAAFDEIYERYWKKLYNESFKRLRSMEQVEELVQSVFVDLWTKKERKNIQNIYAYLLTAVRYQVYMLYKKGRTLPQFEEPLEHMALSYSSADSLLNEKEIRNYIAVWLALQPEKRGEIFRMKFMEERTTKEISEHLGISQKTVQNQIITSHASLREFLQKIMIMMTIL
ncbi:RNA polymerase sigma-70 factor (ECF subfamily) [Pedobacter cryoconitis]|uniref:RNA polymerase sigma-70 factor (ECF subfamily) n=1 Tax=Pedobacter cryoconitis TaxID=188932 RepID=A0A7W9DZG0_9SPHI|nr:sigma-70 family RNA polymerase sigma factor [Pedobacter cryoconitis]MBB5636936.1 RNA polymerase sigma-70 factor (ECF subfamily) [Pedobacter cryoconitis]